MRWSDWAFRLGISGYDRDTRRRLTIVNMAGYLSSLSSISFAINFSLYNFEVLKWLILGNLISAIITFTAPFWHRFNSIASPIVLTSTVAITLFFFRFRTWSGFRYSTQLYRFSRHCFCDIRVKPFENYRVCHICLHRWKHCMQFSCLKQEEYNGPLTTNLWLSFTPFPPSRLW